MAVRTGVVLQLGLISTQVNIESAVAKDESLSTVCVGPTAGNNAHVPAAIKAKATCPECSNTDYGTFKKARVEKGSFVIVEQQEVADARESAIGATKEIIALTAHAVEEMREQTIQTGNVYYLTPYKPSLAAWYGVIRDTLYRHPEYGFMGLWTPRSATGLYEVRLYGDTLVMEGRARTDAIKVVQQVVVPVDEADQRQIDLLLPTMVKPFDPATYADTYAASLEALLASKTAVEGLAADKTKTTKPTIVGTVNLSSALGAMLAQAGVAAVPTKAPAKKRAPRKKAS